MKGFGKFFLFLAILAPLCLPACKSKKSELQTEPRTFKASYQGCEGTQPECSHVEFTYPEFVGGASRETLKKLNGAVEELIQSPFLEGPPMPPQEFTAKFFQEYEKVKKEFPQAPWSFVLERKVQAESWSPDVLNLKMSQYSFTGGAHPNTFTTLQNFNPQTGERLQLSDILKPEEEARLTQIAEKIFRREMNVPSEENLEEAGFFFKNGVFKLSENFLITPEGLQFYYNPYEAAAYVVGPIELTVPWGELQGLLKMEVPKAKS